MQVIFDFLCFLTFLVNLGLAFFCIELGNAEGAVYYALLSATAFFVLILPTAPEPPDLDA